MNRRNLLLSCFVLVASMALGNGHEKMRKIEQLEQQLRELKGESQDQLLRNIDLKLSAILTMLRYAYLCEAYDTIGRHYFGGGSTKELAKKDALTKCLKTTNSPQELNYCEKVMGCERGLK